MEKNTVTIEIKQEVSITLLWIVAGVVLVLLAYFPFSGSTDMWPAASAACVAATIYIIALVLYVLRNPISMKFKAWIGISAVVVLSLGTFDWTREREWSEWGHDTLIRIRGVIWGGITIYNMNPVMFKVLKEYYHPGSKAKENFVDIFTRDHPGAKVGSNVYKPDWEGDSLRIIVTKLEPTLIELVSEHPFVTGRDPNFRNYNGRVGMIQSRIILTEKGLNYVDEN